MVNNEVVIPRRITHRICEEARKLVMSSDEYLIEVITKGLDLESRAREYIETPKELVESAKEELRGGNVGRATEKLWGATALAVKAYAWCRGERKLTSHGELWRYVDVVTKEFGDWVRDSFYAGYAMHTCFYEGWCTEESVKASLTRVEKLVKELSRWVRRYL